MLSWHACAFLHLAPLTAACSCWLLLLSGHSLATINVTRRDAASELDLCTYSALCAILPAPTILTVLTQHLPAVQVCFEVCKDVCDGGGWLAAAAAEAGRREWGPDDVSWCRTASKLCLRPLLLPPLLWAFCETRLVDCTSRERRSRNGPLRCSNRAEHTHGQPHACPSRLPKS